MQIWKEELLASRERVFSLPTMLILQYYLCLFALQKPFLLFHYFQKVFKLRLEIFNEKCYFFSSQPFLTWRKHFWALLSFEHFRGWVCRSWNMYSCLYNKSVHDCVQFVFQSKIFVNNTSIFLVLLARSKSNM